jgi:hypothetical protein
MPPRQQFKFATKENIMITSRNAINLATAAAMMAMTGAPVVAFAKHHKAAKPAAKPAAEGEVVAHCYGINTCKGTSDCATASTSCKGQNECKGQGFKAITKASCAAQGGSLTEKAA